MKKTMALALLAAMLVAFSSHPALADESDRTAHVFPPKSKPFGETYSQWAAEWWTWALSIPPESNPVTDTTGAFAGVGQHGPVWFLAGVIAGSGLSTVTRTITVPEDKALFFPIINVLWTTGPADLPITVPQIRDILEGVAANFGTLRCEIDGLAVRHLHDFLEFSSVFSLTVSVNNIFGLGTGFLPSNSPVGFFAPDEDTGVYLMVAPLARGQHTIHFSATTVDASGALDVTYLITTTGSANH
jgi:hypothetical protein